MWIVMLVWLQECAELRGFSLQQEVCRGRGAQASGVQSGQGLGPGQLFSTDMLAMFDTYKQNAFFKISEELYKQ